MLAIGGFIDLFPFVMGGYGIAAPLLSGLDGPQDVVLIVILILALVGFVALAASLARLLQGGACKRCPNFSCAMNRVPDEVRDAFLRQNPTMEKAWREAGGGEA